MSSSFAVSAGFGYFRYELGLGVHGVRYYVHMPGCDAPQFATPTCNAAALVQPQPATPFTYCLADPSTAWYNP